MTSRHPPIQAHDVRNLEHLVTHALNQELAARTTTLTTQDYASAHAYLLAAAWEETTRYNPARAKPHPTTGQPTNLASYLYQRLRWRYTDWLRWHHHNTRHHPNWQPPLSLDHHTHNPNNQPNPDAIPSRPNRLDSTLTQIDSDPATHRSPDLQRVLHQRNRVDPRILDQPRPSPTQRTR